MSPKRPLNDHLKHIAIFRPTDTHAIHDVTLSLRIIRIVINENQHNIPDSATEPPETLRLSGDYRLGT